MNLLWQVCLMVLPSVILIMIPDLALASWSWSGGGTGSSFGNASTVGNALCGVADAFAGEVASGIATIAVCTVGTLACIGRVQWTTAIVVAVGIAVLFGAIALVTTIAGASYSGC